MAQLKEFGYHGGKKSRMGKKRLTRKTTQRKNQKNGFRKRSRQRKGGLRADWTFSHHVKKKSGDEYDIYMSEIHPGVHITYRGDDNFHATPQHHSHRYSHFGHNIYNNRQVEFYGNPLLQPQINDLMRAWGSFNEKPIKPPTQVVRHFFSGDVKVSGTPTPREPTDPDDYRPFKWD